MLSANRPIAAAIRSRYPAATFSSRLWSMPVTRLWCCRLQRHKRVVLWCCTGLLSFWVSLLSLVRVKCLCEDSSAPLENGLLEQRKAILMHSEKSRLETTVNPPLITYILLVIRSFWNCRCDEQRWAPGRNVEEQILAQDKLYSLDLTCIPSRGTTRSNRWKTNNESSASP